MYSTLMPRSVIPQSRRVLRTRICDISAARPIDDVYTRGKLISQPGRGPSKEEKSLVDSPSARNRGNCKDWEAVGQGSQSVGVVVGQHGSRLAWLAVRYDGSRSTGYKSQLQEARLSLQRLSVRRFFKSLKYCSHIFLILHQNADYITFYRSNYFVIISCLSVPHSLCGI